MDRQDKRAGVSHLTQKKRRRDSPACTGSVSQMVDQPGSRYCNA
jgi:hypothetical protein